jgi:hydrogenase maturation protein HypF
MAENVLDPPVLGVSWDGAGYGLDGTIWGGEFFCVGESSIERVAHFRSFPLPGGDQAIKEPRRTALGVLFESFGESAFDLADLAALQAFASGELRGLRDMLRKGLHSPRTSSAGRLFDAVASLAGIRQRVRFEGQAAMELEFALEGFNTEEAYEVSFGCGTGGFKNHSKPLQLDWLSLLRAVLNDVRNKTARGMISARFHNGLVEAILGVARQFSLGRVVLSGGCFQNRYLTERAIRRLQEEGFRPYWHQRVPPNDGGIALGQVAAMRFGSVIAPAHGAV